MTNLKLAATALALGLTALGAQAQEYSFRFQSSDPAGKVTIHNWSPEERAKFRGFARGEWEKVAAQSPNAQKVFEALNAYLTQHGLID